MINSLTTATLRINRDLQDIRNDPAAICSAGPVNKNNIFHWSGAIMGPQGTPYEGGVFFLDIQFPQDYPKRPPVMKFTTQIFHPNVGKDGGICVDILSEGSWIPEYSIGKALIAVDCLLNHPNPASPLNREAAMLFQDKSAYETKVAELTRLHAVPKFDKEL